MRKRCDHRCIEPLEGRRLLSGLPADPTRPDAATVRAEPAESVELVERDLANVDDGTDTPIAIRRLPAAVRAALDARFPGADLADAVFSSDDTEFELTARFAGRQITVAVQPDGAIVETGESVPLAELPAAVVDWVRQNMSRDQIVDAAFVVARGSAPTYELRVAAPSRPAYDVSLRVLEASPSSPFASRPDAAPPESASPSPEQVENDDPAPDPTAPDRADTSAPASAPDPDPSASAKPPAPAAARRNEWSAPQFVPSTAAATAINRTGSGDGRAGASAEPRADRRFPLAAALAQTVRVDVDAVAQRLRQAEDAIDALVDKLVAATGTRRNTWRLALLVASITAGHFALRARKQRAQPPVLARGNSPSTWSWVIGTPAVKRPRI